MLLSIVGLFRTVLIIIAVFAIVRFVGRMMVAYRNGQAERQHAEERERLRREKQKSDERLGKVEIIEDGGEAEDVDFEEVEE